MVYINLIALLTALIYAGAYLGLRTCYKTKLKDYKVPKLTSQMIMFLLFGIAFVIRMICAFKFSGHSDLECFEYWAKLMYENGPSGFYKAASFADYPPGYMYVLWAMEGINRLFKFKYASHAAGIVIKSFPILCDMVTAFIIYKIAKKRFCNTTSYIVSLVYLLNPAVILNSAVWGQVDSVFFLGIFLMCYYATTEHKEYCYIPYIVAMLVKPQAIMFTPIILLALAQDVFLGKDIRKKFFDFKVNRLIEHLKYIGITIVGFLVVSIPFGLTKVMSQYIDTMASYEYASVNAYNFWSMFGLNWTRQYNTVFGIQYKDWGTIFIVLICIFALFIWLFKYNDDNRYVMIAIFVSIAMFTMSVRMHERYIYPGVILLLLYFILTKHIQALLLYFAYTIAHFYNCAYVLFFYNPENYDKRAGHIIVISAIHVILFVIFVGYIFKEYVDGVDVKGWNIETILSKESLDKEKNLTLAQRIKNQFFTNDIQKSKVFSKMTKYDYIILLIIMAVYSIFALRDLGDMDAPQSFWVNKNNNNIIRIELDEKTELNNISYYNGYHEDCEYAVRISTKGFDKWQYDSTNDKEVDSETEKQEPRYAMNAVFFWSNWPINMPAKYIEIEALEPEVAIGELVLVGDNGKIIKPKSITVGGKKAKELTDEQKLYPEKSTFRNSTYFDEIYHARTGYEFIHGLYTYEWTHPPLGKWFISLGIQMFGMCPFGWRIMGTIFGILMVPAIYLFGKRLFNKTSLATIACIMFTFDFMHFAQTRIATIDVYVTLFVILMYYFMYKYYATSFYDTKLSKTFIPLLCSGICMGLGCASKWTGCYAAVGLAIVFFSTVFKRTHEYNIAKANIEGKTNGIKHSHIVNVYKGHLIKTLLFCCLAFIVIPAVIYTLSYIPFVGADDAPTSLIGRMIDNQKDMFTYHSNIEFEHGYSSKWYEWGIMIRPIFYYSGTISETLRQGISSFGNPLVWWLGIPAFVYIVYRMLFRKDRKSMFLCVGYLAELLPWVLVSRLTFIYHYFTSVPFVVLMNVYAISQLLKEKPALKKYVYIYTGAVVVVFFMFYPVLSGQTVSESYVKTWLRWVESWVLVSST